MKIMVDYADVLANNFIIYASFYYGNEKI
jgi:hypothetical protein